MINFFKKLSISKNKINIIKNKTIMYDKIKQSVLTKGYKFFDTGNYNLNIVFERTSDVFTDFFTDKCHIAYREKNLPYVLSVPCSTKAGFYYVNNPITYQGVTGVAVIMPKQYLGVYEFVDDYVTWLNYPFFRQIKGMDYWRDFDKDTDLDKVQPQINQNFGTHFHRGSNPSVTGYHIYNWSAGCLISEEPYFKQVVELARKSVLIYGDKFSITVLEEKDMLV